MSEIKDNTFEEFLNEKDELSQQGDENSKKNFVSFLETTDLDSRDWEPFLAAFKPQTPTSSSSSYPTSPGESNVPRSNSSTFPLPNKSDNYNSPSSTQGGIDFNLSTDSYESQNFFVSELKKPLNPNSISNLFPSEAISFNQNMEELMSLDTKKELLHSRENGFSREQQELVEQEQRWEEVLKYSTMLMGYIPPSLEAHEGYITRSTYENLYATALSLCQVVSELDPDRQSTNFLPKRRKSEIFFQPRSMESLAPQRRNSFFLSSPIPQFSQNQPLPSSFTPLNSSSSHQMTSQLQRQTISPTSSQSSNLASQSDNSLLNSGFTVPQHITPTVRVRYRHSLAGDELTKMMNSDRMNFKE